MSFFKENKKPILIGVGVVTALAALAFVLPKKDATGKEPSYDDEDSGGNFTPQQVANSLLEAMKGLGTDEAAIIEALTPVASEQMFAQVFDAFGVKSYLTIMPPFVTQGDLKHWLKSELSTGEYNRLKGKYPNYL